jgi:hypothetical protein
MEDAFLPVVLISRVFGTFSHSRQNSVLQTCHKIYCFIVCGLLSLLTIQVVQEINGNNKNEDQQETPSENMILKYCALIFAYFTFLFNWIVLYLTIFRSFRVVELVNELKAIAANMKCEESVSKKVNTFLIKYIVVFVAGTLLCLYQELATWKEELQYNNRIIITFSASIRMIWQEIQLTTFAHTTCLLLRKINTRIEVKADSKRA